MIGSVTLLQTEAYMHAYIYIISFTFSNNENIVISAVKNASS